MENWHRWHKWLLMSLLVAVCCLLHTGKPVQAAGSINQENTTICVGGKTTLKLSEAGTAVQWTSSKPSVAKVSAKGVVTGRKKGKAVITAVSDGNTYTCKVTVNQTYGAGTCAVSIRKAMDVTLTLTENSTVNYKINNTKICSASWSGWNGNDIQLHIVPKKVGTTWILCTNKANDETVRIRVTVTGVPVNATDITVATNDGGDLVNGLNTATLSFKQDRTSAQTKLYLLSSEGETIRSFQIGRVVKNHACKVKWDGCDSRNEPFEGKFRMKVVADKYVTKEASYHSAYKASPFQSGDGSKKRPYEVVSVEQFKRIKSFPDRYFTQTKDIDLNFEVSKSLFSTKKPFCGVYDGQNLSLTDYFGAQSIFGNVGESGTIQNLSIENFTINGKGDQNIAVVAEENKGKIANCKVIKSYLLLPAKGELMDAAFAAVNNYGTIEECSVLEGTIYGNHHVGGLVVNNQGKIIGSSVCAELNLTLESQEQAEEMNMGGIAAKNEAGALLTQSSSRCKLEATGSLGELSVLNIGGIAGTNAGQISYGSSASELQSKVSGVKYLGVLVGRNDGNVMGVAYLQHSTLQPCGTGNGREDGLVASQTAVEAVNRR